MHAIHDTLYTCNSGTILLHPAGEMIQYCLPKLDRVFLVEFCAVNQLNLLKILRIGQSPFLGTIYLVCTAL